MKVARIHRGTWGKIVAFFDIETAEGIVIKGFKLVNGINGLFVGMPSIKDDSEDKYNNTCYFPDKAKKELEMIAINEYNRSEEAQSEYR